MHEKAGAQISTRAFIQSVIILFALMMAAGILTQVVPAGEYARLEVGGREMVDPDTFQYTVPPDYPIWRWFTAPIEVLFGPDGLTIIVIIIFLLMVGVAFAVMDKSGLLKGAIARIVQAFGGRKQRLILAVALFFMVIGAFFGIFEEVVPLVPLMLALSYFLGWDALAALGMSVLAVNMGFSAAVTNPFTVGVAQEIAGLPLFSGAWLRIIVFISIFIVTATFLSRYTRMIRDNPKASPVYEEDRSERHKYEGLQLEALSEAQTSRLKAASFWLLGSVVLILIVLMGGPFIPAISDFALPLVGLLFFIGGVGAALLYGTPRGEILKAAGQGLIGIAPAVPLILMAASVSYIVVQGGILDTILYSASRSFVHASPFIAALMIYALALLIEFFVASGSAKAFLIMPIVVPLADLVGVTRQTAVLAYCFGDGFSNMLYPTNPVLLICLGLTVISYPKWLKWSLKLWAWILLVTILFLGIAVAIDYGPF